MNRTDARKLGNELRAQGKTYQQIADELDRRGYRTANNNRPHWYDVNYLLNAGRYALLNKRRRSRGKAALYQIKPVTGVSDLIVIKEIAFNHNLPCETRLDIIKAILEPKQAQQILTQQVDTSL